MCTELMDYYRAGFPVFLLRTNEPSRVKYDIELKLREFKFKDDTSPEVISWTVLNSPPPTPGNNTPPQMKVLQDLTTFGGAAIAFLYNYHWFLDNKPVIQMIQDNFSIWANERKAIVIVSPVDKLPPELEKDVTIIELSLPKGEEIKAIVEHAAPSNDYMPTGEHLEAVIANSKGMTKRELQNVYNLSLVKTKSFDLGIINEYRSQAIKKSGIAKILKPKFKLEDIIGYDLPKKFVMSTVKHPEAKGVIFIGPPGCGKTSLIEALANASNKLAIIVNTGQLFSKYQGETDKNVRALIDLAWTIGDSFFIFDEIEKQFSGVGGSGELDSGVTSRAIAQFLDFFQNRPPGCYCGGTANSFKGLPPEYLRAGRWDTAPIFIDLPNEKTRSKILEYYIKKFALTPSQCKKIPKMENWSGSEIETLCHNAKMTDSTLVEAKRFVLPLYDTTREQIEELRAWANGRTIQESEMTLGKETKRSIDI